MATLKRCEQIVDEMLAKANATSLEARQENVPDRTIELVLLDLDTAFRVRTENGELVDFEQVSPGRKSDVRVVMNSDDLVAMNKGELKFASAWASGRVRLDANIRDLLRLRSLM